MSTTEILNIAYKQNIFLFTGGKINEGMVVPHYNISLAKIEYYFIPTSNIEEYMKARENRNNIEAYKNYGNKIDETMINAWE